ncbi:hypothetical protein M406DRAFT_69643 [Cryphonectria parasitica EP155]|uniref:Uncharacterized protein n=1 Tax=Cryphonectria parasitica (strain ATCC 38755 / EP155) TaxID=660469 RepID=A0A9P4Y6Z7_CRYP1|nr:uncharacterized protein M406DRAFT_69643 [Cryphonectria parasitica EP155]KAF3767502.1 hypothetical protein M406DRAFT_69643 [Cryphonectria parasitica EP155]
MSSSRRHRTKNADYKDASTSSEDGSRRRHSNLSRGYRPGVQREDSLIKTTHQPEAQKKYDSGWDTDYDPKDKYYLSDEEDPLDSYFSPRAAAREPAKEENDGREQRRQSTSRRRKGDSQTRSHGHSRRRSPSPSRHRSREDDADDDDGHRRHKTTSSKPNPASHTNHHSRPQTTRAASSYRQHRNHAATTSSSSSRPRTTRAASSTYTGSRASRPRPRRGLSDKSIRTMPKHVQSMVKRLDPRSVAEISRFWDDFPWQDAAKVAMQAGTIAAIKVGTDSIPWPVKGTKIASAALGAAVVDHVFKPKKKGGIKYVAMRHLAEAAVGSLVVGPALGKASKRSSGGGGGGGGGGGRTKRSEEKR